MCEAPGTEQMVHAWHLLSAARAGRMMSMRKLNRQLVRPTPSVYRAIPQALVQILASLYMLSLYVVGEITYSLVTLRFLTSKMGLSPTSLGGLS